MKNIPILGLDDGGFQLHNQNWKSVSVFGVIMKGSITIEGIIQTTIDKDDKDPTSKIISMIASSTHSKHIQAIIHEGITIGGFGIIDINQIYRSVNIPVILILRSEPNMMSIKKALSENIEDGITRWKVIDSTGNPEYIEEIDLYVQYIGLNYDEVITLIKQTRHTSKIPEAVRIAHMIGNSHYTLSKDVSSN